MFISSMSELPKEGDVIKYKLMYRADEFIEISGAAVVKWLRPGLELGRPPGFGVQFDNPSESAKELIQRLVAKGHA
jgi:Tfp pilus assembly protein PilZ